MKDRLFRSISPARKHSPSTQLRKLVIFFLHSHIFLRKLWLNLTEPSINKIALNQLAKSLILNQILNLIRMISIDKTGHRWTMTMHVNIHEHSRVSFLVELSELTLLITSVFVVLNQELSGTNRWTGLGLLTFSR